MLIPFFNLPSFLIGMYFGLVNYTIQRGVNNLYKEMNINRNQNNKQKLIFNRRVKYIHICIM